MSGDRGEGVRGRQEYLGSTNPLTILKVKLMEIHPFHEVTQGLRLKGSEAWITNLPTGEGKKKSSPSVLYENYYLPPQRQQVSCRLGLTRWLRSQGPAS